MVKSFFRSSYLIPIIKHKKFNKKVLAQNLKKRQGGTPSFFSIFWLKIFFM